MADGLFWIQGPTRSLTHLELIYLLKNEEIPLFCLLLAMFLVLITWKGVWFVQSPLHPCAYESISTGMIT
jgi:hypothetical protein